MNIVDAGYINDKGEYIEDLMYFSFDYMTPEEKKRILDEQEEKEYKEYQEYERNIQMELEGRYEYGNYY